MVDSIRITRKQDDFRDRVCRSPVPVILTVQNDRYPICQHQVRELEKLEWETLGQISVLQIDSRHLFAELENKYHPLLLLAEDRHIDHVPTMILFDKGNYVTHRAGFMDAKTLGQWLRENGVTLDIPPAPSSAPAP